MAAQWLDAPTSMMLARCCTDTLEPSFAIHIGIFMAEFFKTSTIWVVDFRYEGRARRWFRAFGQSDDVPQLMRNLLRDWYGERAQLVEARKATEEEELQYLRGEEPRNAYCPTGSFERTDRQP